MQVVASQFAKRLEEPKPRRMVKKGNYYGPRKISSTKPESDPALSEIFLVN